MPSLATKHPPSFSLILSNILAQVCHWWPCVRLCNGLWPEHETLLQRKRRGVGQGGGGAWGILGLKEGDGVSGWLAGEVDWEFPLLDIVHQPWVLSSFPVHLQPLVSLGHGILDLRQTDLSWMWQVGIPVKLTDERGEKSSSGFMLTRGRF